MRKLLAINVRNMNDSKLAQDEFFRLGYFWNDLNKPEYKYLFKSFLYTEGNYIRFGESWDVYENGEHLKVTLQELKEM